TAAESPQRKQASLQHMRTALRVDVVDSADVAA
ncbi:MAG: hypothetical protein JWP52_2708, partial [Rhizobacter sp.]|nr:hypothetical protein [Rhizobacter sp.]